MKMANATNEGSPHQLPDSWFNIYQHTIGQSDHSVTLTGKLRLGEHIELVAKLEKNPTACCVGKLENEQGAFLLLSPCSVPLAPSSGKA